MIRTDFNFDHLSVNYLGEMFIESRKQFHAECETCRKELSARQIRREVAFYEFKDGSGVCVLHPRESRSLHLLATFEQNLDLESALQGYLENSSGEIVAEELTDECARQNLGRVVGLKEVWNSTAKRAADSGKTAWELLAPGIVAAAFPLCSANELEEQCRAIAAATSMQLPMAYNIAWVDKMSNSQRYSHANYRVWLDAHNRRHLDKNYSLYCILDQQQFWVELRRWATHLGLRCRVEMRNNEPTIAELGNGCFSAPLLMSEMWLRCAYLAHTPGEEVRVRLELIADRLRGLQDFAQAVMGSLPDGFLAELGENGSLTLYRDGRRFGELGLESLYEKLDPDAPDFGQNVRRLLTERKCCSCSPSDFYTGKVLRPAEKIGRMTRKPIHTVEENVAIVYSRECPHTTLYGPDLFNGDAKQAEESYQQDLERQVYRYAVTLDPSAQMAAVFGVDIASVTVDPKLMRNLLEAIGFAGCSEVLTEAVASGLVIVWLPGIAEEAVREFRDTAIAAARATQPFLLSDLLGRTARMALPATGAGCFIPV
jgi:hypothetical protein